MHSKLFSPNIDPTKREEILDAAQKVFSDVGFAEATVRQICKAAKANVCLISYYFGGKDGLYKAIIERSASDRQRQIEQLLQLTEPIESAEQYKVRLQLFIRAMNDDIRAKPEFFKMMHREIFNGLPKAEEVLKETITKSRKAFADFIEYGQKRKFIRKDVEPVFAASAVMNMLMGFNVQQMTRPDIFYKGYAAKDLPDLFIKTVQAIFFDGVTE